MNKIDIKKTVSLLDKHEINGEELELLLLQREINNEVKFLLIDVREDDEYQDKRIKGVDYLIPLSNFKHNISIIQNKKDIPIITQCRIGARSATAQNQMLLWGFKTVINLAGGITHYKGKII
tara:strand:+ start:53914 stop:54279 length:366 start_codon:yes stop_codon:yes gene_type:complete